MAKPPSQFPPLHIIQPSSDHQHTILLLHGLGSNGPDFAERFFASKVMQELKARRTGVRWVFPTAKTRPVTAVYQSDRPAWFEIDSIRDLEQNQQTQMDGLLETVQYMKSVLDGELAALQAVGRSGRDLFVFGRSQGSSAAVWTSLNALQQKERIGGLVLVGSWLIFARAIAQAICGAHEAAEIEPDAPPPTTEAQKYVVDALKVGDKKAWIQSHGLLDTPIHISHSTDDVWIGIELGGQMRNVLTELGCNVEWREFVGAEDQGHWIKDPEEFEAIDDFLESQMCSEAKEPSH